MKVKQIRQNIKTLDILWVSDYIRNLDIQLVSSMLIAMIYQRIINVPIYNNLKLLSYVWQGESTPHIKYKYKASNLLYCLIYTNSILKMSVDTKCRGYVFFTYIYREATKGGGLYSYSNTKYLKI